MDAVISVADFLEPQSGPGADELDHRIASNISPTDDKRYETLGEIERWQAFNQDNIALDEPVKRRLAIVFEPPWKPWLPDLSRIILNERQLDVFFYQTLMTRINLALHATTSILQEPEITIMPCLVLTLQTPSGQPTSRPDWVVIEGSYTPRDTTFLNLTELEGRIIAIGDTKIIRHKDRDTEDPEVVPGTRSCRRRALAQLQHYCTMLWSRFGFILTNHELVVTQFLREEDASPRSPGQRGLRSFANMAQLASGILPSSSLDSDAQEPDDEPDNEPSLPTLTPQRKRTHQERSSSTSPLVQIPKKSRPVPIPASSLPSSPVLPGTDHVPNISLPLRTSSQEHTSSQERESDSFKGSARDIEIGRVLVRSFEIPNTLDSSRAASSQAASTMHPAKALFSLIMLARSVGVEGRRITTEELEF
ncbi:Uncharacterized protein TCAP_03410 [Tolypocladium capitatum]|uniref:Uncharacterized protein n=1 Tax=Tolypocladium capitatum TaxID=45235 RepID=A0A2K3QGK3_9HYPO|nr:Uncharacterized protein TCAP_03410 [Tolypocladium capitatum]